MIIYSIVLLLDKLSPTAVAAAAGMWNVQQIKTAPPHLQFNFLQHAHRAFRIPTEKQRIALFCVAFKQCNKI